eukprot:1182716-Prorocentrum_minimum.AAC.4
MHTLQRTCRLSHIPVDHQHMRMTEVKKSGRDWPLTTVMVLGSHSFNVASALIVAARCCHPSGPIPFRQHSRGRQAQQPCTTSTYNINVVRMSVACWSTAAHNQQLLEV